MANIVVIYKKLNGTYPQDDKYKNDYEYNDNMHPVPDIQPYEFSDSMKTQARLYQDTEEIKKEHQQQEYAKQVSKQGHCFDPTSSFFHYHDNLIVRYLIAQYRKITFFSMIEI